MKTRMFLLAAAAAALAGCAQNEVIDIPQTRAIGFDPYVGNTTRAAAKDTDLSALQDEGAGFIVLGGYEDDQTYVPVFDGTNETGSHITWNKRSWEYSPINYWLEGKTYKFVAYAPAKLQEDDLFDIDYADNKLKMKDGGTFTADGETDLVVAEGKPQGYLVAAEPVQMEPVGFKFYHALSKVKFTFINGWRNAVTLKITNIKLSNVKDTGSLTTSGTMAQGSDKIQLSAWSGQTGMADYENKPDDVMNTSIYGESYEFENFLLPIALNDSQMKLTFTVLVTNSQGTGPDLGAGAGYPVVKEVVIPKDVVTEWKPGYAYNYKLTISGSTFGLKPIQFDGIDVDSEWGNGGEDDIENGEIKVVPGA
ncbi:fimbrillin family protein [Alistipes dispar]|uniref:fimbrillin family protein n=1 Tax=Alistipes dispar TaxID=2585119 RepID=UPI003BF00A22